jgi:hypothetical protein
MSDQLHSENRKTLVSIASLMAFPYLWLGLFILLGWLYRVGFFGRGIGGFLLLGLLGLMALIPAVPFALTRFVVRPILSNLLGREVITAPGCITGLISVVFAGLAAIYFLSRGTFDTAGMLLLIAPVVGMMLAGGVSLLSRGSMRLSRSRTNASRKYHIEDIRSASSLPDSRSPSALPSDRKLALPTSTGGSPTREPPSRRKSNTSSSRRPPPRGK